MKTYVIQDAEEKKRKEKKRKETKLKEKKRKEKTSEYVWWKVARNKVHILLYQMAFFKHGHAYIINKQLRNIYGGLNSHSRDQCRYSA
jgi:23S rRNA G2069 N7-methylase RlmK/C1962 C5-methylase RlmI